MVVPQKRFSNSKICLMSNFSCSAINTCLVIISWIQMSYHIVSPTKQSWYKLLTDFSNGQRICVYGLQGCLHILRSPRLHVFFCIVNSYNIFPILFVITFTGDIFRVIGALWGHTQMLNISASILVFEKTLTLLYFLFGVHSWGFVTN